MANVAQPRPASSPSSAVVAIGDSPRARLANLLIEAAGSLPAVRARFARGNYAAMATLRSSILEARDLERYATVDQVAMLRWLLAEHERLVTAYHAPKAPGMVLMFRGNV